MVYKVFELVFQPSCRNRITDVLEILENIILIRLELPAGFDDQKKVEISKFW